MKYIKTYKIFETDENFVYDTSWEDILPTYIKVIKGDPKNPVKMVYKRGISRNLGPELQIPYETMDKNGGRENPDTLELDIYWNFNTNTNSLDINVEFNYGELTVSQFSIKPPNKVDVIVYTSLHSKDDPSNTIFAIDDNSLKSICDYFNRWDESFELVPKDFSFLDVYDNYLPS